MVACRKLKSKKCPITPDNPPPYFRKELSVFPANSQIEAFSFLIAVILSLFSCLEKRGKFNKFSVHFVFYSLDRFSPINLDSEKTKTEIVFFVEIPSSRKELNVSPAYISLRINPSGMNSLSSQLTAKVKPAPFS